MSSSLFSYKGKAMNFAFLGSALFDEFGLALFDELGLALFDELGPKHYNIRRKINK